MSYRNWHNGCIAITKIKQSQKYNVWLLLFLKDVMQNQFFARSETRVMEQGGPGESGKNSKTFSFVYQICRKFVSLYVCHPVLLFIRN